MKRLTALIGLAAGLFLIAWGLLGGEFMDLAQAGSTVCLECMGLGG